MLTTRVILPKSKEKQTPVGEHLNNSKLVQKMKIKELNSEMKIFFISQKRIALRRRITSGKTLPLWSTVKIAKGINVCGLPRVMYLINTKITDINLAQTFAHYFENKVNTIILEVDITQDVYNG